MISLDKYEGVNCIRTYPMNEYVTSTLRFTSKENNENERMLVSNYWREQIDLFGQKVLYYTNRYSLSGADNLYGEHTLAGFNQPREVIVGIKLSENSLTLSKFGFRSDDDLTAFIHISGFYSAFGPGTEPKSGDVIKLVEYGSDRPGERDGKMYEFTERVDEDNESMNPLMGHYVWMMKARRFEYSYEPNITPEKGLDQVHDDTFYGILSSGIVPDEREPEYPKDMDSKSKDVVFDMSKNNTLTYGGYY